MLKNSSKTHGLHLALSMIDLTTLDGKDTPENVKRMCYKANHLHDSLQGIPKVAAVCVYPTMVKYAKKELKGTKIKVASVATGFPSGQSSLDVKLSDTKFAVNEGADEIDMVISRGKFLAGEYNFVFDEIAKLFEEGLVSSRDLANELITILKSKRDEVVFKMKLTSKDEFEVLSKRVENLEKKLNKFESKIKKKTKRAKRS